MRCDPQLVRSVPQCSIDTLEMLSCVSDALRRSLAAIARSIHSGSVLMFVDTSLRCCSCCSVSSQHSLWPQSLQLPLGEWFLSTTLLTGSAEPGPDAPSRVERVRDSNTKMQVFSNHCATYSEDIRETVNAELISCSSTGQERRSDYYLMGTDTMSPATESFRVSGLVLAFK